MTKLPCQHLSVQLTQSKAIGVFEYMNHAEVKSRMQLAIKNVETELSNIKELTGEKTDIAALWRQWIEKHLVDMPTSAKKLLTAKVKLAESLLTPGLQKYDTMYKALDKKEGPKDPSGTVSTQAAHTKHFEVQEKEKKKIQTRIDNQKKEVKKKEDVVKATEKELTDLYRDIKEARAREKKAGPNTSKLEEKKENIKKTELPRQKKDLVAAQTTLSLAEREVDELYSHTVKQIVDGLKQDQATLKKFSTAIGKLAMPKAA